MNLKSFSLENLAHRSRRLLDRLQGLDFMLHINPEDVGLDPELAYQSCPSGNKYLVRLLKDLNISSQDTIIDIGCGKGSAMRTMLKFPFARVDGIELSEHIAAIAERNLEKMYAPSSKIFVCDASLFKDFDGYNMVYLYNPFPASIMSSVMDALIQSIHRQERELVIIYNNATCHNVVVGSSIFSRLGLYPDEYGNGISIYSNRIGGNSRLSAIKFDNRYL